WLQLGRGRLGQHPVRNGRRQGVAIAAQLVDRRLEDVLQHPVAARDVAIKRAVAGGELRLVAGGEHDVAELVGQRVEDGGADARLQVFLRHSRLRALEGAGEYLLEPSVRGVDGE